MNKKYLLLLAVLLLSIPTYCQLSAVQTKQIDSIFTRWDIPNHPGGSIGIMKNGEIVYSKAFGLASLEYQVPNDINTIFNTGSVSKQFTAMGIVVLHLQGLLSVDDNIRSHLPDLPDFGDTITIRHMLHHTSGLRSLHAMFALAGWRDDDSRTNEDLYRFMLRQEELNFKPGSEYLYCNTGYMLMANIIEKVTNQSFPIWMKENIFMPLGLKDTYVENNYARIVPNNATSYYEANSNFERAVEYWGYVGSGNMHSTVTDLLQWLNNFNDPTPSWDKAFEMLQTIDPFNDGSINRYAFGINVDSINGHKRIQHGGAIGGFRAFVSTYPEDMLSVAILTNFSSSNPGRIAGELARHFLDLNSASETSNLNEELNFSSIKLPLDKLKSYAGNYWNDQKNYARKIYVKNDTLRYWRSEESENPLIPIEENKFKMLGVDVDFTVTFVANKDKGKQMIIKVEGERPETLNFFVPTPGDKQNLQYYLGKFYSPELESIITISLEDGSLSGYHARHGKFPIKILKDGILEIPDFGILKFNKDGENSVTGFRISNGRARNVWFQKINL